MSAATKRTRAKVPTELHLRWSLAELPSSQHRAGLAGLVMMVEWLHETGRANGLCELEESTAHEVALALDQDGLRALFDAAYDATQEESHRTSPFKKRGEIVDPKRVDERETTDKRGKTKIKKYYVYEITVPGGAFLADDDSSGDDKLWLKLWQNMVWSILRGVPATRKPFEDRANRVPTKDVHKAWKQLTKGANAAVDLPSTYFIGAQAATAESVPFRDRARFHFLLHFWPYACQVYVPTVVDNKGAAKFGGFVLAIPDVAELRRFCRRFRPMLRNERGTEKRSYRPRDAVVDVPAQGALELSRWLVKGIETATSNKLLGAVLGIDTFHLEKRGNNIVLLNTARVVPTVPLLEAYTLARELWDARFKREFLRNLLAESNWHSGFDRILSTVPYEQTLGSTYFRHDARRLFSEQKAAMDEDDDEKTPTNLETIIYRFVGKYVRSRLRSKYDLDWKKDVAPHKANEKLFNAKKGDYEKKKGKLALDAFLAARSRSSAEDFVEFFASTLASVPQFLPEDQYVLLSRELRERPAEVRTLTMLALCANA